MKRLDDALKVKEYIRAVVRNTGLNQDGRTSQQAQQNLIRSVYQRACINPLDVSYVESHETNTQAGDFAEAKSIAKIFCDNGNRSDALFVGFIKSNIGHLEACSGLASLIKAMMVLEKGTIPPNHDLKTLKENLPLE